MTNDKSADDAEDLTLIDYGWSQHFQAQLTDDDAGAIPVRVVGEHRGALDAVGQALRGGSPRSAAALATTIARPPATG